MKQSNDNKYIPMTSVSSGKGREVKEDIFYYTDQIVNIILVGKPGHKFVLIDAGMPKSGKELISVVENRYGRGSRPEAILLTHGHFDHVGSIVDLIKEWDIPVFAHKKEFPFLTGKQSYPKPDSTVEGGLLAKISFMFPVEPIDITDALSELPADKTVPYLPGWQWIETPGHSPGHVSFYRPSDKILIAGDAFITVRQDSLYKVLFQKEEINGPPRYLTTDWATAWQSVKKLEALQPELAITGHGTAMKGKELKNGLTRLAENFQKLAVPDHGKFVNQDY